MSLVPPKHAFHLSRDTCSTLPSLQSEIQEEIDVED